MDVTLPNGQVIKGVPEGTPKDEIARKAVQAGLAKKSDFPEIFKIEAATSETQKMQQTQPSQATNKAIEQPKERGFFESVAESFTGSGRTTEEIEKMPSIGSAPEMNELSMRAFKASLGSMTTGNLDELKGIFKAQYGDDVNFRQDEKGNVIADFPSGSYALNKPGFSIQDIPKFVADFAAFTPAGRAGTVGGAIGRSALAEAGLEGVESSVGGEFTPGDVVEAAVLGGAFKGAEDLIGTGYRALRGAPQEASQELVEQGAQARIPLTTSDVFQPQTFAGRVAQQTGEKIPFAGTGAAREGQQQLRSSAVEEFTNQFGDFSYNTIVQSLRNKTQGVRRAAGERLESLGRSLDEAGVVPLNNTNQAVNEAAGELSRPNVLGGQAPLDDINQLVDVINNAPQTYTTLKENRTAFREIVDSLDPTARSQLTSRAKSLLRSVERGMTRDMEAFARQNLQPRDFRRLQNANEIYAREAQQMTATRLKGVLDKGDFTPENVKQMLFSQKPSEMNTLFRNLTTEGRQNARAAIINKITTDLSKRANGLTPNSFATELRKYNPQIQAFFKNEDRRALEGLRRVLDASRRAQEASVTTPTGQSLIGGLAVGSAFTDLGATLGLGGTVGGLARLYESEPVRNALIRLAGTRQGSTAFEQVLREANEALISGAQAIRSAESDKE